MLGWLSRPGVGGVGHFLFLSGAGRGVLWGVIPRKGLPGVRGEWEGGAAVCGECSVNSGEVCFIGCVGRIGGVSFRVGIARSVRIALVGLVEGILHCSRLGISGRDMWFREVRVRGPKLASWWVRRVCVFLCGLGLHMLVVCRVWLCL